MCQLKVNYIPGQAYKYSGPRERREKKNVSKSFLARRETTEDEADTSPLIQRRIYAEKVSRCFSSEREL